jgi:hypothetical protein
MADIMLKPPILPSYPYSVAVFSSGPLLKAPTRRLPSVDPSKIPGSSLTAPVPRNGDRQGDPSGFLFEPQTWEEGILVLLTGFLARHLALMSPRLAPQF